MSSLLVDKIREGIPSTLPPYPDLSDSSVNRAPIRRDCLNPEEKKQALKNALRYFDEKDHPLLAKEFAEELKKFGHIYMYRLMPDYEIKARSIDEFPHRSKQAACIMLMLSNNLDRDVAQHPLELITYGGNGGVFQNWAQYRLTMKYLSELEDDQTLVINSGHPLGIFPSHKDAPRVVVTNGMVIPNYSKLEHYEKFYALGVTQYGQMTAGSFMYIGPQGIVHGTTITVMNAGRIHCPSPEGLRGKLFVSSGLGGMSGAQGKAGVISGAVTVIAEINPKATEKRHAQGWVQEVYSDLDELTKRVKEAQQNKEAVAIAYDGNIVDLFEYFVGNDIHIDIASDQTSLHNAYGGGYYPVGLTLEESNSLMASDQEAFKKKVHESLRRHVAAINKLTTAGMYFFDYGNAFLLESSRAGADITKPDGSFKYPSYVENIMGPLCFDHGFGPFRWVCSSCRDEDLAKTDEIATAVLESMIIGSSEHITQQLKDNIAWIKAAQENKLVVGSKARILYADALGRIQIAKAFNEAVRNGELSGPIILGRDHHDVSGTDSPYRETANINDGSKFTADMAIQNVIGDSFRGATWVSIHNGGGVGWGEVINGGFGLVLDGSEEADRRLESMLHWDVNNGVARRSWAQNPGALHTIKDAMKLNPRLKVTLPHKADDELLDGIVSEVFR